VQEEEAQEAGRRGQEKEVQEKKEVGRPMKPMKRLATVIWLAALALTMVPACAGAATTLVNEDFEGQSSLPLGWADGGFGGGATAWGVTSTNPVDGTRSAAIAEATTTSFHGLVAPPFVAPATPVTVTFRHNWAWEVVGAHNCDGGILLVGEVSGESPQVFVVNGPPPGIESSTGSLGASFTSGPYNGQLDCTLTTNPLGGAQAWVGTQAASVTSSFTFSLPASLQGKNVGIEFLAGTDASNAVPNGGWRVDDVNVTAADPVPSPAAAKRCKKKKKGKKKLAGAAKKKCKKKKKR
jgi:hypothetical protein